MVFMLCVVAMCICSLLTVCLLFVFDVMNSSPNTSDFESGFLLISYINIIGCVIYVIYYNINNFLKQFGYFKHKTTLNSSSHLVCKMTLKRIKRIFLCLCVEVMCACSIYVLMWHLRHELLSSSSGSTDKALIASCIFTLLCVSFVAVKSSVSIYRTIRMSFDNREEKSW